ncbi:zonular occludens toxin domain-containing protein [Pseudomonas aeruginosa]|nr:zonular occludens toxin domain-containing protein [Pseudomonas aeruginosa]
MAIDAYVGKPGHGKSYGVVEHVIIPSLKQDRHVVTNIPLEVDMLLMDFGGTIEQLPEDWFEREDLADFAPPGSVLVLDELWRRWPKGQKTNDAPMADKKLLAEHRHRVDKKNRSMRVVMVTQDLDQLASWAVLLVETTYRMVKKSKTMFRVDIYNGVAKGDSPPKSKLLRSTAGRFKPDVYRYYKSATQSETGGVGDESKADTRG